MRPGRESFYAADKPATATRVFMRVVYGNMSPFSGHPVLAMVYLSVDYNTGPYTGTYRNVQYVLIAFRGSPYHFRHSGRVSVIFEFNGYLEFPFDYRSKRDFLPSGKVRGIMDNAFQRIQGPGSAKAYTFDGVFRDLG